jgi:hypothetical protein
MGNYPKNRLRRCWRFETIFNRGFNTNKTKSHGFFSPLTGKNIALNEQHQHQNDRSDMQCYTKNKFYSVKNSSKLCTEGAIGNLMNVIHCHEIEVNQFWAIVQSPMHLVLETLNESSVPKAMLKSSGECDSIKKVFGFFIKNSSSIPQICYELNASTA